MTSELDLDEIPGWFDYADIYDQAVEEAEDGDVLVEVGSWMGCSAVYLAQAVQRSGKKLQVVCVDPWKPWGHEVLDPVVEAHGGDLFEVFWRNVERYGVQDVITPLRMGSVIASDLFLAGQVHFVFLDGDHSLEAVRAEVRAWLPKLKPGGILAGHDYDRPATVRRGVLERFGSRVEARAPRSWLVRVDAPRRSQPGVTAICLALNVKNEEHIIARCIESAAPYVDGVVCADTGSTDGTIAEVRATCERLGLALKLHERPWENFADSFTQLLREAQRAGYDYGWVLDADEEVVPSATADPLSDLTHDGYDVCRLHAGDWEVWTTRVFRLDRPWQYVGTRHAAPVLAGPHQIDHFPLEVINHRDGMHGAQDAEDQRARFRRDVVHFLERVFESPGLTRSWYYLAQSAKDAGLRELAEWAYRHRAALSDGFEEEQYLSLLQIARWTREPRAWEDALNNRPWRAEAYCEYAQQLLEDGDIEKASKLLAGAPTDEHPGDRFLVRRSDFQWRASALTLLCELAEARQLGEPDSPPLMALAELAEKWGHPELWAMFEKARNETAMCRLREAPAPRGWIPEGTTTAEYCSTYDGRDPRKRP